MFTIEKASGDSPITIYYYISNVILIIKLEYKLFIFVWYFQGTHKFYIMGDLFPLEIT